KNAVTDTKEVYSVVEQRFIELWGDMSSWWGVSRPMAEIHGFLFITSTPHSAEDIQKRLGISRGNVSMNIRTLVEWGLVRRVRKRGDRGDYSESLTDVWEMSPASPPSANPARLARLSRRSSSAGRTSPTLAPKAAARLMPSPSTRCNG